MENLRVRRELITPISAQHYLNLSKSNRNISTSKVARYAKDMMANKWVVGTGETIKVSNTNVLLDGHHRLRAVLLSQKPIVMDIAFDLQDSVFTVIDTGKSRNSGDCFRIAGIKHFTALPAIILNYYFLSQNKRRNASSEFTPTNNELLDMYLNNSNFWDKVAINADRWYSNFSKILNRSLIGGIYSYLNDLHEVKAQRFMNELCTGANVTHPIIISLRNKLIQDKLSSTKLPNNAKLGMIIKAWNIYSMGKPVTQLRFEYSKDVFPIAIKPNLL